MTKRYSVIWSKVAEDDLTGIIEYIAADSRINALKILHKVQVGASRLYQTPEKGRIVPELKEFGVLSYRELIIPPWRLIYRISQNRVYVLSVIDARRNVEDILLSRLINQKL
jgi:toxin ParE1/3/4